MSTNNAEPTRPPTPVTGFFQGDNLELNWRYAYRPEFIPLLMDYLGARPGMCILDVGCGAGFLARLLVQALDDVHVVGLDADRELLKLAYQMLEREALTPQIELRCGNAYHIPYPDESFDLVASHTLL